MGEKTWRVPTIGIPPNHPFVDGFSLINHPCWVFPCMETPTSWILSGRNDGTHFDGFWDYEGYES
jgi:hypothetical protein